MRNSEREIWRYTSLAAALFAAALTGGCGVTSPQTVLPAIDHSRPATLLGKKQQDKVFKDMGKLAEDQKQRAATVTPITYKVPEKSP